MEGSLLDADHSGSGVLIARRSTDPAYLIRLALDQAVGATAAKAITEIFGTPATENERGWLQELRDASDN